MRFIIPLIVILTFGCLLFSKQEIKPRPVNESAQLIEAGNFYQSLVMTDHCPTSEAELEAFLRECPTRFTCRIVYGIAAKPGEIGCIPSTDRYGVPVSRVTAMGNSTDLLYDSNSLQ